MKTNKAQWILGILVLLIGTAIAYFVSPKAKKQISLEPTKPSRVEELLEIPANEDASFYTKRRTELGDALDKAPEGDPERDDLAAGVVKTNRELALSTNADRVQRWNAIDLLCSDAIKKRDVQFIEELKRDIDAKDFGKETRLLDAILDMNIVVAKAKKATDEKDRDAIEKLFPDLQSLTNREERPNNFYVYPNAVGPRLSTLLEPFSTFDKELGDRARLAMRKWFRDAGARVLGNKALVVEYPPQNETATEGATTLEYNKTLLTIPRYEDLQFYKQRAAELETLLARVPKSSEETEFGRLRVAVANALNDVWENETTAFDLYAIGNNGEIVPAGNRDDVLRECFGKLAENKQIERLERLANDPELADVAAPYLAQAKIELAGNDGDPEALAKQMDDLLQWSLTEPDDILVIDRIEETFAKLSTETAPGGKENLASYKKKYREAFQNAEDRSKRRLAKIDCLK